MPVNLFKGCNLSQSKNQRADSWFQYRERNNLAMTKIGNSISVNYETESSLRMRKFYR
ncbi:hypothetical protein MC7420_2521 [Coleofasciculus chthonoplastes PCC 7420]|uniref:Uncharacterized protein n=1 Tax=Coleofasciculus chthonoplastes PCC 7420 TaxID=118168 RepID=B4VZP9_9CYAN|nr:hypothetical protein MC7420_2521 [Coleofasciculus chthonoplastes PCC 7420]